MGYSNTMLARYLARLGADVHYVTTDLPVYHKDQGARSAYRQFTADATLRPGDRERYDGYTVHCVPHRKLLGAPLLLGLHDTLRGIRPDIVQLYMNAGWVPLQAVCSKLALKFKLFTAAHTTVSVFPLAQGRVPIWDPGRIKNLLARVVPGRIVNAWVERCYAATDDCAQVAIRFYGATLDKVAVVPLGVDTENFYPARSSQEAQQRSTLRASLGFDPNDLVCIYTGQFSDAKNPRVLAQAVTALRAMGEPVRAVFIGNGVQRPYLEACEGCVVLPFMPHRELPPYYRAADIGVWPTQESMSMLDAAACGLPIIVNDTLLARERIEGNGVTYRLNDSADLARQILLLRDPCRRAELGAIGARRMVELFSWDSIARRRLAEYHAALCPEDIAERVFTGPQDHDHRQG